MNARYNGQSAAIQDCLYRQMASSRYVVFSDLDEFVVPRHLANWTELARSLERPLTCGFQFLSAFFDPAQVSCCVLLLLLQHYAHSRNRPTATDEKKKSLLCFG